jgi:hydrogenase maturation factor HypE
MADGEAITQVTYDDPETGVPTTVRVPGVPVWDGNTLRVGNFMARAKDVRLVVPPEARAV